MNNVNGILLVVGAMAAFALEDMFIKLLSVTVPTGQIMVVLGVVCGLLFAILAVATRKRIFDPVAWQPLPLARAATEMVGALTFRDRSVAGGSVHRGRRVSGDAAGRHHGRGAVSGGTSRLAALERRRAGLHRRSDDHSTGFEGFQPDSLFVVATVIAIAARDLITRKLDPRVASSVVALQAYFAVAVVGCGADGVFRTTRYSAAIGADRSVPWCRRVWCSGLLRHRHGHADRRGFGPDAFPLYPADLFDHGAGMLMFGERPDFLTFAGAALIMGSGMYTFIRERKLARELAVAA